MDQAKGIFRVGTSGIVIPGTKETFPEPYRSGSRLHYYSSRFNTLEVNSSFYKVPQPATFEKWAHEVPDDFKFTVKLWRAITHQKKLLYNPDDITSFLEAADRLRAKKGCLLVQFPASIKVEFRNVVARILKQIHALNKTPAWNVCVEFRDVHWYTATVYEMLDRYDASLVLHDMPDSKPPVSDDASRVVYLRFHGPQGDCRGGYTPEFLQSQAALIKAWLAKGKDVYAYFNNTIGTAFDDAQMLRGMI